MKSWSCITALRKFGANPTVVSAAESNGDDLLKTVSLSVGESEAVSLFKRFATALRAALS